MSTCPKCGGKSRGAKMAHDRSCTARFAATRQPAATHGPLTSTDPIPEITNLYDDEQIVPWLAYVGLGGRWSWAGTNRWLRWDGKKWKRVPQERVREAVRRALTDLHERSVGLPGRDHLLTVERAYTLREKMRRVVKIDAATVGVDR